jgi:microcystin-dependent protein
LDPFIGQIILFSFPFAPRGFAQCNGQLLPINQNQALFALLGTRYGGDGRTTFALPDLRGRAPVHRGRGSTLAPQEMATRTPARSADPAATPPLGAITLNFCIALQGIFPSRS